MKKILCLALVFIMLISVAGCAQSANPGSSSSVTTAPPASSSSTAAESPAAATTGGEITWMSFLKPGGETAREVAQGEMFKIFTEKTGITINPMIFPWAELETQVLLSVKAGNPPDVSYVRYQSFESLMSAGALQSLQPYVDKNWEAGASGDFLLWEEAGFANGEKYAIPTSMLCSVFIVRKDYLKAAGISEVPSTWDEVLAAAKAIKETQPDITPILYECLSTQPTQIDFLQPMIESRGGKIIDSNGQAVFNSQAGIDTLQWIRNLMYESKVMPTTALSMNAESVMDAFTSGKTAMLQVSSTRIKVITADLEDSQYAIVRIPGATPGTSAPAVSLPWMLSIPTGAKNADNAWAAIDYFVGLEAQTMYTELANEIPVNTNVLNSDFLKNGGAPVINFIVEYLKEIPTIGVGPSTYSQLTENVAIALQESLMSADSDIPAILEKACNNYNTMLANK